MSLCARGFYLCFYGPDSSETVPLQARAHSLTPAEGCGGNFLCLEFDITETTQKSKYQVYVWNCLALCAHISTTTGSDCFHRSHYLSHDPWDQDLNSKWKDSAFLSQVYPGMCRKKRTLWGNPPVWSTTCYSCLPRGEDVHGVAQCEVGQKQYSHF